MRNMRIKDLKEHPLILSQIEKYAKLNDNYPYNNGENTSIASLFTFASTEEKMHIWIDVTQGDFKSFYYYHNSVTSANTKKKILSTLDNINAILTQLKEKL